MGVGTNSTFAVASQAGLLGLSSDGKVLGRIAALPAGSVPSGPVLHPDRKRIFFALVSTTPETGFGSDIWSVNVDGTGLAPVVTRDAANVFYASPTISLSGDTLYVHRRAAKDDPDHPNVYLEAVDTVERIELATGARHKLIDDAAEPAVSPNGRTLVFLHMDRGQQAGLWSAPLERPVGAPFLKTGDRFWFLQAPRISPLGTEIVWSSAGRSSRQLVPGAPSRGSAGGRVAHLEVPSELYVASMDGLSLRSIAMTNDDVVPAWSLDGTKIAYIAGATFYVVSAKDGEVLLRSPGLGVNYGDPIWLR